MLPEIVPTRAGLMLVMRLLALRWLQGHRLGVEAPIGPCAVLAVGLVFVHWRMTRSRRIRGPLGANPHHVNLGSSVPLLRSLGVRNILPPSPVGESLLLANRGAGGLPK
jgi:hypothetical protein